MAYLVGVVLALGVGLFATLTGLDRDRAFYPTVMIVIAAYYALFTVMGGAIDVLVYELGVIAVFVSAAVVGFRHSLWLVAAALAAHGVYDLVHARLIDNPGVPEWWPAFCSAYDIVAASYLATVSMGRVEVPVD